MHKLHRTAGRQWGSNYLLLHILSSQLPDRDVRHHTHPCCWCRHSCILTTRMLPAFADANNTLRLVYSSTLDITHKQQQQQHHQGKATAISSPGQGLQPTASDSTSSSVTPAAGLPWLGLAGLSGLMQAGTVQEEVRVRMTQVARQLAELATQLVSVLAEQWCGQGNAACHVLGVCWVLFWAQAVLSCVI